MENTMVRNVLNITEETKRIIGEDFNPFNRDAKSRIGMEMDMFVSAFKGFINVMVQAKNEEMSAEDIMGYINKEDLEFINSIIPEGTSAIDDTDMEYISSIAEIAGEDYNPFNWDAKTRIPLQFGMLVMSLKTICHIFIQAEKENVATEELLSELSEQALELINIA